jgi:hypothetical protein
MHLLSPALEAKVAAVMYHENRVDQLQRALAELEQQKQEQEQLLQQDIEVLQRALAELEQQKQGQEQLLREDIKLLHAALGISGDNE